jgi:hypothetical protein
MEKKVYRLIDLLDKVEIIGRVIHNLKNDRIVFYRIASSNISYNGRYNVAYA